MEYVSEIHRLLKLGGSEEPAEIHGIPAALPIAPEPTSQAAPAHAAESAPALVQAKRVRWTNFLVYPLVFILAFGFFYVALNFSSIWAQVSGYFTKPQDEVILGDDLSGYYDWIGGYYFSVGDAKLLDPNNDIDKDGLSNVDEYTMRTNPTLADSDSDGYSDGTEVINGYNPWGSGKMNDLQTKLVAGLDLDTINNRITYNASATTGGQIAGADTANYNLDTPGQLSIPRLNLQVPLIWSKDPSDFDKDLTEGVIHYPGTALPGQQGTMYVSGHSSDYIWKVHPYKQVFAKLNYLQPGDDVFVTVYGQDGTTYTYRYQVTGNQVYAPDDQSQFIDNSTHKLNLSTCWPIGTQQNRLVVSAVQVSL